MTRRLLLPKPGDEYHLSKFGYSLTNKKSSRQSSLKAASKKFGTLPVLKRVNLIRNITNPEYETKKKLTADVKFMKELYKKEKRTMERAGSKRGSKRNTKKGTKKTSRKTRRRTSRK
jgi:hypothetical protein